MSAAPDYAEPALGFRAWLLPDGGRALRPASYSRAVWEPGPNRAACHALNFKRGLRDPPHAAPHGDCSCGLYAFHAASTLEEGFRREDHCAGVVAGWGELELHQDGFRAEWAAVLALAGDTASGTRRDRLAATAARYRVPLIPFDALEAYGREFARPLVADAPAAPARAPHRPAPLLSVRPDRPSARYPLAQDVRYLAGAHAWARREGELVYVGIAAPAREVIAWTPRFDVWPVGRVGAGDLLATIASRDGGAVAVRSPVSGELIQVNRLAREVAPHVLRTMPYGQGWIARIRPSAWRKESQGLLSAAQYALELDRLLCGESPLESAFGSILRAPLPATGTLRSALRPWAGPATEKPRPAFASAAEMVERLGGFLRRELVEHPASGRDPCRADVSVDFRHTDPAGSILVELRPGRPAAVRFDQVDATPDAVVTMTGGLAHRFWRGDLDVPAALARREITVHGSLSAALLFMSVVQPLFPRYRAGIGSV
ncbi:MAG: hypothetical protein WD844_15205 [Thermoleophilaceae bacterium]